MNRTDISQAHDRWLHLLRSGKLEPATPSGSIRLDGVVQDLFRSMLAAVFSSRQRASFAGICHAIKPDQDCRKRDGSLRGTKKAWRNRMTRVTNKGCFLQLRHSTQAEVLAKRIDGEPDGGPLAVSRHSRWIVKEGG